MKKLIFLLLIPLCLLGQQKKEYSLGLGLNYNKYPISKGFENYVFEAGKQINQNWELGLNTRYFQTKNIERINTLDNISENKEGEKYIQYQNNIYAKYLPYKLKFNPFLYSELGFQVSNSKLRNLKLDSNENLRVNYTNFNLSFGGGLKYNHKNIGLSILGFASNNKTKHSSSGTLNVLMNSMWPVYNISVLMNYKIIEPKK